jgi:hypothetical protein
MRDQTRRKIVFLLVLTPFLFVQTRAKNPEPMKIPPRPPIRAKAPDYYASPDAALIAKIIWVPADLGYFESRIQILSKYGKVLRAVDLTSPGGEHGGVVAHAEWSPDSQFFVATYSSSGGHSPWHEPALCYRRSVKKFYSLDDYMGDVASPGFLFTEPDIMTIGVCETGARWDRQYVWLSKDAQFEKGFPKKVPGRPGQDIWFPSGDTLSANGCNLSTPTRQIYLSLQPTTWKALTTGSL